MFLSAGNIHRACGSKFTDDVRGAMQRVPLSGALFLTGFLVITGSPPFGPFISEFTIVNAAILSGQYLVAGVFPSLLGIVLVGVGVTLLGGGARQTPRGGASNHLSQKVRHRRTDPPLLVLHRVA